MKYQKRILIIALVATGLLTACSKFWPNSGETEVKITFKTPSGEPLAKIGNAVITVEQFDKMMKKRSAIAAVGVPDMKRDPKQELKAQIEKELLAQEAIKQGYLDRLDVQQDLKSLLVRRMTKENEKNASAGFKASEEEVKAFYDGNPDLFHKPEKVKASFVFLPFGADKSKSLMAAKLAKKKIGKNTEKIKKPDFESVVSEIEQSYGALESEKASAKLAYKTR